MVLIKVPQSAPFDPEDENMCGIMSESDLDDDIEDPDWEEVKGQDDDEEEDDELEFKKMPILPSEGVDIIIEDNRSRKEKKKKGQLDLNELVRKHVNKQKIQLQLNKHKISLLLFVARGLRLIKIVRCDIVKGLALSIVDEWLQEPVSDKSLSASKSNSKNAKGKAGKNKKQPPPNKRRTSARGAAAKSKRSEEVEHVETNVKLDEDDADEVIEMEAADDSNKNKDDRKFILSFLQYFNERIAICDDDDVRSNHLNSAFMINLLECFKDHQVTSLIELVVMFAACLKAARPNLPVRILNILRPITMRADIITKGSKPPNINDSIFEEQPSTSNSEESKKTQKKDEELAPNIEVARPLEGDGKRHLDIDYLIVSNLEISPEEMEAPKSKRNSKKVKQEESTSKETKVAKVEGPKRASTRAAKNKNVSYQEGANDDSEEKKSNPKKRSRKSEPGTKPKRNKKSNSSDEEQEDSTSKAKAKKGTRQSSIKAETKQQEKKSKQSEEEVSSHNEVVEKLDFWIEIYLENEKRWICVDVCNNKIDEPEVLNELNKPFYYLLSFDIDRNCIKPAEQYYCPDWYAPAFKRERCDPKWWHLVLDAYGPPDKDEKDGADETKSQQLLTRQDMPKSDNAFRNHPLYVLQKHLLKFQVIYPPDVVPVGYFKDEPVYPRDSVHICRSRETWLREARVVKLGEYPYKVVKARPKWDKYAGELRKDLPLEIFGEWQTEPYDPPVAENGKVPRNVYGNVDMYKPCMLPKGCVHLKLPGLQRIANKLNIDCASAVIGFDNHCGSYGAHPVTDGFVVCKEYQDTLEAAWDEEQHNALKRDMDKRQKRILDNWKRLLKAAIIREKLRVKYKD